MEKSKPSMEKYLCFQTFPPISFFNRELRIYRTRSEVSWQLFSSLCTFSLTQKAGYKHFGFSTILHCLKDLCKNKK